MIHAHRLTLCCLAALLLLPGAARSSDLTPSQTPPVPAGTATDPLEKLDAGLTPPTGAVARQGGHLSVRDALNMALRHNPNITALEQQRQASQAHEMVELSGLKPRMGFESIVKDGPNSAPGLGFAGLANSSIVDNYGGGFVLSMPLMDFGRAEHRVTASQFTTEAATFSENAGGAWVGLQVYKEYAGVLQAQKLRDVAVQDVASRRLLVRQAEARFDAGLVSRVDVDFARASLAESQVRLMQAQSDILTAFAGLDQALGVDRNVTWDLDDIRQDVVLKEPATSVEDDVQQALRQRPEMQALEVREKAVHQQALAFQADEKPFVRMAVTGGDLNVSHANLNQDHTYAGGLMFSWPMYTGGQVQGEVSEALHQASAVRAQEDVEAQAIRRQVTQDRLQLATLLQSAPAYEELVRRSRDLLKLAQERYAAGLGNLLEIQEAEAENLTAENNMARLYYSIATTRAALQYDVGVPDWGQGAYGKTPGGPPPNLYPLLMEPRTPATTAQTSPSSASTVKTSSTAAAAPAAASASALKEPEPMTGSNGSVPKP